MKRLVPFSDFKQFLLESFSLGDKELSRLLDEINSYYELELKEFIQLRHLQLKNEGLQNAEIFETLQWEIEKRRFKAGEISLRQIRRIIYG
jgi:hypothetical protein